MKKIALVGTGGTIAGIAPDPQQAAHYQAGVLPLSTLMTTVGEITQIELEYHEPFCLPSEDLGPAHWGQLLLVLGQLIARTDLDGVVITHGTDTLEETAFFLSLTLTTTKPVVLTGAMRPANAPDADGPGNLRDALKVAKEYAMQGMQAGVMVVFARQIFAPAGLRKHNAMTFNGFVNYTTSATLELTRLPTLPQVAQPFYLSQAQCLQLENIWPIVPILQLHNGIDLHWLRHAQALPMHGLVLAGFGYGTLPTSLITLIRKMIYEWKVLVVRASKVEIATVIQQRGANDKELGTLPAGFLSPAQARILLCLALLGGTMTNSSPIAPDAMQSIFAAYQTLP